MNKLLRVLGILLIVLSVLLLIAVPPVGVIGVVFGVLLIIKSKKELVTKISSNLANAKEKAEQRSKILKQKLEEAKQKEADFKQVVKSEKSDHIRNIQIENKKYTADKGTNFSLEMKYSKNEIMPLELYQNFKIHNDISGLLWIADGKYKNYTKEPLEPVSEHEYCGMRISFLVYGAEEPSLIYMKQPIHKPLNETEVPRPQYYPDYTSLTSEQKYIYAKLLTNPYDATINIGYVFILYYGLERHLLCGNFESAFRVILKLRDVHKNSSFQSYSADALILSCMLLKKGEFVLEFIKSLDKEHEYNFSHNLLLVCYYSFNIPLSPKDIMRMSSIFEFTNRNYIKKNPDVFEECLSELFVTKLGTNGVLIANYLTPSELKKIKMTNYRLFANVSIIDKEIPVPLISENFKFKKTMFDFLSEAHEMTKEKLAAMRKTGTEKFNKVNTPTVLPQISPVIYSEREIPDDSEEATRIREAEEQRRNTILGGMIPQIKESPYLKPDKKQNLIDMLKKTSKLSNPFSYDDCLTATEKKELGLNSRLKISRQMIDFLSEKGLKLKNPKEIIRSIYENVYSKYEDEWELEDRKRQYDRLKEMALESQKRMQDAGLKLYVWETSGDERVCPACRVMDGKLCLWSDPTVYSRNKGKDWIPRPQTAAHVHPGENACKSEGYCRCTATSYWEEIVGEL
jgi:hypothetical protein